jgi:hypothetical protein
MYYFYSVSRAAVAVRTCINYLLLVCVDRSEAWRTARKIKRKKKKSTHVHINNIYTDKQSKSGLSDVSDATFHKYVSHI